MESQQISKGFLKGFQQGFGYPSRNKGQSLKGKGKEKKGKGKKGKGKGKKGKGKGKAYGAVDWNDANALVTYYDDMYYTDICSEQFLQNYWTTSKIQNVLNNISQDLFIQI